MKLADYGVSQFNAPGGLHRPRGTEEYMAPELFRHNSVAYDEKVICAIVYILCMQHDVV